MGTTDAAELIERDHRAMEELFDRVRSGTGDRVALLNEVAVRLTAHARAEEQEVYPAIERSQPDGDEEVGHAIDEHHEAEHLLRSARNLTGSPHFDEAFAAFVAAVDHHVQEEEREVLPALRRAVDAAERERLGAAFEQTRQALVAELEPLSGPPGTVNLVAAPARTTEHLARNAKPARITGNPAARRTDAAAPKG
ncbi:hemerythrin domain-containing protein [Dactylosporangium vinaceum]|uniref:Hemerythrin domain-containing protein n=1 Tax=Dactylosporangium vinaceum TaxID=53362 RepID=A0ABV5MDE0_9ACTN|nr:hemerythrin domain-containing protein [Dactylosporangium vinaceum]UAC01193.1 hemerythrin domain-containing protein [Dactylosporangium vinaceum]